MPSPPDEATRVPPPRVTARKPAAATGAPGLLRLSGMKSRATSVLHDWLEAFRRAAERGQVAATSAGAGEGRDYAYLHYRTYDGLHSVLVFRPVADGTPEVFTFRIDADQEDIAALVDRATHGPVELS